MLAKKANCRWTDCFSIYLCQHARCMLILLISCYCESDRLGPATQEVCQLETMEGRCRWKSEVIVMTSARWGRMETGRCLEIHPNFLSLHGQDPLFLGCSENVLPLLDAKCSGRSECNVQVPDPDLDKLNPCYPDHERYLEASYTCVKG